jgi:H+/gluconate symporter-like permease
MSFLVCLGALCFLMLVAYRGFSVILFAPIAALLAVLVTQPSDVLPVYSSLFMDKMVVFVKLYFPVFLLGAVFGKVVEISGFSKSIVSATIRLLGRQHTVIAIVLVCALLTYGGVSLFVVVFAVYPFAAEAFRISGLPKRLIPCTIALGAFTFTMDSLPGTPQIQNIIPAAFFKTNAWAAPWLGVIGATFILICGLSYLTSRIRSAAAAGEGYGTGHTQEPEHIDERDLANPAIAILPLIVVGATNLLFTKLVPQFFGATATVKLPGLAAPLVTPVAPNVAIWAVELALLCGIFTVFVFAFGRVKARFAEGSKGAVAGALLASLNTASEYGFGSVIAALPGFLAIREALAAIPNPLINEAISVTTLAGITGSASGGMSIALAAMANQFIAAANAAGISPEVLHRVAAMASGGMDTLPHNGAVITLLAVTGLTHRQSYKDIFAITCIKTMAVFVVIAVYYTTGIV